jgi:hypothetical protein
VIEHILAVRELCPKGETLEHHYPDCFKAHLTDTSCNECPAWDHPGWQVLNRLVCGKFREHVRFRRRTISVCGELQHKAG